MIALTQYLLKAAVCWQLGDSFYNVDVYIALKIYLYLWNKFCQVCLSARITQKNKQIEVLCTCWWLRTWVSIALILASHVCILCLHFVFQLFLCSPNLHLFSALKICLSYLHFFVYLHFIFVYLHFIFALLYIFAWEVLPTVARHLCLGLR